MTTERALPNETGDRPRVALTSRDGARAELYLHGAHVTSWTPAGDRERLFVADRAIFRDGVPIRGGIPVIFPQFAGRGPLPKHGFARTALWSLLAFGQDVDGRGVATMRLVDDDASRALWPHSFACDLSVRVGGDALEVTLAVRNSGDAPFDFTCALHSYLRVDDIAAVALSGLRGVRFTDTAHDGRDDVQHDDELRCTGEVDRVYRDAPSLLVLEEPGRSLRVVTTAFPDCVVWNPGAAGSAAFADLEPDGFRRFMCVEAAAAARPLTLAPGERWEGVQRLIASPS